MTTKKILPLVLVLGLVLVAGFFLFKKNLLPENISPEFSPPAGEKEETFDDQWLIYTNDKYQYEIKYHLDWKKQGENEPPYPPPPAGMNFSRKWLEPLEVCDFQISSSDLEDNFQGEIESLSQDSEREITQATIGGEKATKFTFSNETQLVENYYFTHNGNAFNLGFNILRGEHFNTCQQVFEKMITSFKFL